MSQRHPTWTLDPADPRAPPRVVWDAMSRAEQDRVVAALPSEPAAREAAPP
ncbi:MAG: Uma2 family endonuclease, partial [Polyangiaceae bacterium]|nr:Uma2 family endonuclease [Polyangiaceae bacterium]